MPIINQDQCIGCNKCVDICPVNAISIKNGKAFIDQEKCIHCKKCLNICPTNAIERGHKNGKHHHHS